MIANYPSLKNIPIEPTPGYFAPIMEAKARFPWQSKILVIIASVGFVVIAALNILVTAPAKAFSISKLNNYLHIGVKYLIDETDALKYKSKRLNYRILERLVKSERPKIENLIYQNDNILGTASPYQLASSKSIIFNEVADFMQIPQSFWTDFLDDIFSNNAAKVQTGLDAIDDIFNDSTKLQEQVNIYEQSIKKNAPKYSKLNLLKEQLKAKVDTLKNQLGSGNSTKLQDQINKIEKQISATSNEMDQLISKEDIKTLKSWNYFKNKHFERIVKEKLMERKAFLQSIKLKKNLLVSRADNPISLGKIMKISLPAVALTGICLSIYNNGVSSSYDQFKATTSNFLETADYGWKSLTFENLKSMTSSFKSSFIERM